MIALATGIADLIARIAPVIGRAITASQEDHATIIRQMDAALATFEETRARFLRSLEETDRAIDAALLKDK